MRLRSFLDELERRHVVRVIILYAGVVFVVLQAADIVFPALALPESAFRVLVVLSLLGFPVVLVVAWIFDLTPRGVVRTAPSTEKPPAGPVPGRSHPLVRVVLLGLTLAVFVWASWIALRWTSPDSSAAGFGDPKSIAVLPFEDMNETDETAFFTNGIHEDIITHLARIADLRVISRTSVMQYQDARKPVREIAQELGVGTILEGSVRQADGRVRVVTQLIDAASDDHLWSQTYDREKEDVFAIQSEIAQAIAQSLQAELSPEEQEALGTEPTDNLEAYDAYLQGRFHTDRRENREDALRAVELYETAVDLDPGFAVAHAALAQARMWLFWNWPGFADQAILAVDALDRAEELAPSAVETRLAQGFFHFYGRGDYDRALEDFSMAERLQPSNAEARAATGFLLRRQGRWDEAVSSLNRALQLDPRSYNLTFALGQTYRLMRRFEESARLLDRAASLAPDVPAAHVERFRALLSTGDTIGARRLLEERAGNLGSRVEGQLASDLALFRGDVGRALELRLAAAPGDYREIGILSRLAGRREQARAYGDSLQAEAEASLAEIHASPGLVQTGVLASAHARLGIAHALLDEPSRAVREGTTAAVLLPLDTDAYAGAEQVHNLAIIYVLLGEHESGMDHLEQALAVPSALTLEELRRNPLFDSLRDHPRFQRMLEGERATLAPVALRP